MVLPKKTADTLANAGLVAIVETKPKASFRRRISSGTIAQIRDLAMQWVRSVLLSSAQET